MAALRILGLAFALAVSVPVHARSVERWRPHIDEASARFGVPAEWIERVMQAESGGRTTLGGRPIVSRAGAMGLMQLMPGTWAAMRARLRANAAAHQRAVESGKAEPDPLPVVKFFNPVGAATWLATELDADGDTLFGLADLGFGCPEPGSFSLREIAGVRLPFSLSIERDEHFAPMRPLSVWADTARRLGSIIAAESELCRSGYELPPSGG